MQKRLQVYGLVDPRNHNVYYVGRSINCKFRFMAHWNNKNHPSNKKDKKSQWLRRLEKLNLRPFLVILQYRHYLSVDTREGFWINHFRKQNPRMTNLMPYRNKAT